MPEPTEGGIRAAAKYNPHLWNAEELRAIFVARQRELDDILDALRHATPDTVPQHRLLTGLRGMGKTTLLQRVALAVEDDAELGRAWVPLRFPEEQYTVSTLAEFWANVLDALADALERQGQPTDELDHAVEDLQRLPAEQREGAALALLDDWSNHDGRRLLLLVDSTDLLFANLAAGSGGSKRGKDAGATALWSLRKTLLHDPRLFWLGGSYQALEADTLYHDAFLDFFQVMELRPLTLKEMRAAMQALARAFGAGRGLTGDAAAAEITRTLTTHPERLKTLRQLTGGNPRTTVMLYELFAAGGEDNVKSDLERLLDMMTPLYKARIEALADQPRKLLAHIMEHWAPISLKQLAAASQLPNTSISAQLQRLEQEGLIEKTRLPGTTRAGYQVAERFFNIWYLMRNAPRRLRVRLAWLVGFMRLWYSADELGDLARRRLDLYRLGGHPGDSDFTRALATALPDGADERLQLEWAEFKQVRESAAQLAELFDLEGEDRAYKTPEDYLKRFNALPELLRQCPHAKTEEEKQAFVDAVMGSLSYGLDEKEHLARLISTISRGHYDKLLKFLVEEKEVYQDLIDSSEALFNAVRAGEFFPDTPDSRLAYTQMLHLFSEEPDAFRLAYLLLETNHQDEWAAKALRKLIKLNPNAADLWNTLGNLLTYPLHDYEGAEAAYRKAIELASEYTYPVAGLARLQARWKRQAEATATYREVVRLATDNEPNLKLQAHLWLGNRDLAMQALDELAREAGSGYKMAFNVLREQAGECTAIGLGASLAELMEASAEAGFLQPFALALRAAAGEEGALDGVPPEVHSLAEEVLQSIRKYPG